MSPSIGSTNPGRDDTSGYRPDDYWSALHERGDSSAVGQSGLPPALNGWLYRSWARSVARLADRHGLPLPGTCLYEVGAGTGYWIQMWRDRGVTRIDGCDLSERAVAALNGRFHELGTFMVADIADLDRASLGTYELVECQNVLLHITDDEAFDRALRAIAALVAPGGALLLAEPILLDATFERPYNAAASSRARPMARYSAGLEAAGLELIDRRAYTVVAGNPIEGASRRWYRMWRAMWVGVVGLCRIFPPNAHWIGPMLYALDGALANSGAAPSGKLALFRRPG